MNKNKIFPCLPEEIVIEILSRLPLISLSKFRCVCKSWSILFNDDRLINWLMKNNMVMLRDGNSVYTVDNDSLSTILSLSLSDDIASHTNKIDLPPMMTSHLDIVGSCKGLVCLSSSYSYCLWNPSTKEYRAVPMPATPGFPVSLRGSPGAIAHGFGYDILSDDYKFVAIWRCTNIKESEFGVYSLRSNSWKPGYTIPYEFSLETPPGVLSNGAIHWFAKSSSSRVLISMDVGDFSIHEIPQPEKFDIGDGYRHVDVFDGCLCMLYSSKSSDNFEVWIMKDYGVKESWMQAYSIPRMQVYSIPQMKIMHGRSFRCLRQIQCLRNGELLCEIQTQNADLADDSTLALYDQKDDKVEILKINRERRFFKPCIIQIGSYVQSSVSLNSGTYVGDQEQEEKDLSVAFKEAIWN